MNITFSKICKAIKDSPYTIPLLFVILGLLVFCTFDIEISKDMGWYLNSALNFYQGKGYTNYSDNSLIVNRSPLFPLMLTASFWLFGVSPWSAFWVVRIFAILNPILIYTIGKKFYGKWIGFSAGILILTSYSINHLTYRHLDAVWPFFMLLSLIFLVKAFEKRKDYNFILSGFFLGVSFLVKEVAVLFFLIPLLMLLFIKEYRSRIVSRGVLLYFFILILTVLPWWLYLTFYLKFSYFFGLGALKIVSNLVPYTADMNAVGASSMISNILSFVKGFYDYLSHIFTNHFLLAPLLLIAWIFTIYRAFRKDKFSIILSLCFLCYLPMICIMGKYNLRLGQGIILFLLSYLVTANFLWKSVEYAFIRLKQSKKIKISLIAQNITVAVLIITIGCIQIFISRKEDRAFHSFFQRSYFYQILFKNNKQFKLDSGFGSQYREAGIWIKNNLPKSSKIMISKPTEAIPIYFYSMGDYPVYIMPIIQSANLIDAAPASQPSQLIFISSWAPHVDPQNKLYALTEIDLINAIQKMQVEYILVGKRRNYLSLYFDSNRGFKKIKEFGNGKVKIYRIEKADRIENFKTLISQRVVSYLNKLKKKDLEKFNWYKEKYFKETLRWEGHETEQLLSLRNDKKSDRFLLVKNSQIY